MGRQIVPRSPTVRRAKQPQLIFGYPMNHVESVRRSWQQGVEPNLLDLLPTPEECESAGTNRVLILLDAICEDMRVRWSSNSAPTKQPEAYFRDFGDDFPLESIENIRRLLTCEWEIRTQQGDDTVFDQIALRFPDIVRELRAWIEQSSVYKNLPSNRKSRVFLRPAEGSTILETTDPLSTRTSADEPHVVDGLATEHPSSTNSVSSIPSERVAKLGRYRVIRKLGSGAFGDVYLSFDDRLCRHVAIKVPRRQWLERSGNIDGFLAEARAAASLNHPGIVTTHDVIEEEDGMVLIVMEFIDGGNLQDLIDLHAKSGSMIKSLGVPFIASIGLQTALALSEAHHFGLVHRDLKPANLLIQENKLRITDFGLAISSKESHSRVELAGTPAYMSPEQVAQGLAGSGVVGSDRVGNEPSSPENSDRVSESLDHRSDIWSLGVILYQLATGRLPFKGNLREIFEQIQSSQPVPPRALDKAIPLALESVIMQCLEKDRNQRFESILQVADELRPLTISKAPGFRAECIALPIGIILTCVGTLLGLSLTVGFFFMPLFTTNDLIKYGFESYVMMAATLGLGPPMMALGHWFCCRRTKSFGASAPNIPCRVSRWAVGCLAAASATAGWGPPMFALTLMLGAIALVSIRRRKRWLTGYRHVVAGVVLSSVLMIPWATYWWLFSGIYPMTRQIEQISLALDGGDLNGAEDVLYQFKDRSFAFPMMPNIVYEHSGVLEARLALERGNNDQAIEQASAVIDGPLGENLTAFMARLIRAAALKRAGDEAPLFKEIEAITSLEGRFLRDLPPWAARLRGELQSQPLEQESTG